MADKAPETTEASDPKHAPVSVPAGSYEFEDLMKAMEDTNAGKPTESIEDREERRMKAFTKVEANELAHATADRALPPGHKLVEAPHPEIEGLVEQTYVYDPKLAAKQEKEAEAATPAAPQSATSTAPSASAKE